MRNNNIKGAFNCGMICNTIDAVTHFLTGKEDVFSYRNRMLLEYIDQILL